MTSAGPVPAAAAGHALLAALRVSADSLVEGTRAATAADLPDVSSLTGERAEAVLAAWSGARLHAGLDGLLSCADADLALLVGDWCFAHALQALAQSGDLPAIGALADAIGRCAVLLTESPDPVGHLTQVWRDAIDVLGPR
jgi:hypothetical protein